MNNPYKVPAFAAAPQLRREVYFWWSWHPHYPRWSKSCWGGVSIEDAKAKLELPAAGNMAYYHNKLIRENEDGTLTEVMDVPCKRLDVWQTIARRHRRYGLLTHAKPIVGWQRKHPHSCEDEATGSVWISLKKK